MQADRGVVKISLSVNALVSKSFAVAEIIVIVKLRDKVNQMVLPVLHAWNVALVAGNHSGVSRVNIVATSLAVQRRVIERKRRPFRAFGELIAVCEVAQSTLSLDLAGVPELGIGEEAIPGVSCE